MMASMDGRRLQNVLRTLTARCGRPAVAAVPDADLLRRFADWRDDEAFAELHRRHGPLVWAACRSLLRTPADAEDAYQATFLALVQSAQKVRNPAAVGAWLHGVAVKVGLKLRQRAARQRSREQRGARPEADQPVADAAWERLLAAIHEEVEQLPASLRMAFVLCDLQGVPQADAARRLGWPLGSLSGRLSRARARLAGRVQARGVAPAVAAGVLGVAATGTEAGVVPTSLALAVRQFAVAPGLAPAAVQALVTEVTTMTQLKWAVAAVLAAGMATLGAGTVLMPAADGQPPGLTATGEPAAGVSAHDFPIRKAPKTPSRYWYMPLDAGIAALPLATVVKELGVQAAQGWDFCGSIDMQLTAAEVAALRADHAAVSAAVSVSPANESRATHRVLVFKRSDGPAPVGPALPAGAAGGEFAAPAPGPPADPGAAQSPRGVADLFGAADMRPGTVAAPGQSTVIYRAKVAAAETLEKVAVDLAKNRRRGAVTAIADPRTGSLILTGEAAAIKEIVERLERLETELGGMAPQRDPGLRPAIGAPAGRPGTPAAPGGPEG
jgi:RNA polymerase sigma factor (sigma-70 family)